MITISQLPSRSDVVAKVEQASQQSAKAEAVSRTVSVDKLVAVDIASSMAESTDLPVSVEVANLSVSLAIESELAQNESDAINKPQVVAPETAAQAVRQYVVVDGDSVESIAQQYNISVETLKWANNMTSNQLAIGAKLTIPPADGVIYEVKGGDTVASVAERYNSNSDIIVAYNDLELQSTLVAGSKIFVPKGVLPATERPGYVPPVIYAYSYATGYSNGDYTVVNAADYVRVGLGTSIRAGFQGQCTWYAYFRRAAMGMPIPNEVLGHARSWNSSLAARGYQVNRTPSVGAIIQSSTGLSYYGHVGVVERVNSDGSSLISEMNYAPGPYRVDIRTIPASAVGSFNYIH